MVLRILKLSLRCLLRIIYRVEVTGLEHYRQAGKRVLIVANHTSLLDGVLLYAWLPETPVFAINRHVAANKKFIFFLKFVELFRLDTNKPLSIKSMIKFLQRDKKVVIFPEGRITTTGGLMKIYQGPGLIADKARATILPIAIEGAQFSLFSCLKRPGGTICPHPIRLLILPPVIFDIDPGISGQRRRVLAASKMEDIMYSLSYRSRNHHTTIFNSMLTAARYGRSRLIAEDTRRAAISYKQFLVKAIVLGNIIRKNSGVGEHIGLMLPNIIETLVTFASIQYSNRAVVMINFTMGIQTVIEACATAEVKQIYTSKRFINMAGLDDLEDALKKQFALIYLEDLARDITIFDKLLGVFRSLYPGIHYRRVAKGISADSPAVILFTSGSEGSPKGVVLSHNNILSNYAQVASQFDFGTRDIYFSCLPLFHTFGLSAGFIIPLISGGKIFLYPTPLHYRVIPELVYDLGATILFGCDTFFKGYARHAHPFDFHTLRYVVAGAEKLHDETQKIWMEKFGLRILQGYGVTEMSPVFSANTLMQNRLGSVGRAVPGIRYYLEPVAGVEEGGRLFVKGPNIMLGYLLPNMNGKICPPESDRGEGWYDTGDIVSIDGDGYFYIIGRAKRFAKIAGEMVSLTKIEELAAQIWPQFTHVALGLPDPKKGEKIILITNNKDSSKQSFQKKIKQDKHSDLYLPKEIISIPRIPILGSGKTDYIALKKMIWQTNDEN